jgi:pimeloyl-ACP methyl ester carboxylesterase
MRLPVPASPYGTLTGDLFSYTMTPTNLVAFETSPSRPSKCILLGGLSDGLLPTPYCKELAEQLPEQWSLVQPLLQSSYTGFGHGTLDRDVQDLETLFLYLQTHRHAESFTLMGHSTGCQCIVHYLKTGKQSLRLAVLQAPVSDREHAATSPQYAHFLSLAQDMRHQNKLQEMMPREAFWAPITAERYLDLHERGGKDDYFSSDYSAEELIERLQHVSAFGERTDDTSDSRRFQCCVAYSGADEYVPDHVDKAALTQRLVDAMNHGSSSPIAHPLYLPSSNHNLSNHEQEREQFIHHIVQLLQD